MPTHARRSAIESPASSMSAARWKWWPSRCWAWAATSFIVVFIAAPLGIAYNRRGVVGGVAAAIFIFFFLLLARGLFLALGKGARIDPFLAPWVPTVAVFLVGMILLWFRSTNS